MNECKGAGRRRRWLVRLLAAWLLISAWSLVAGLPAAGASETGASAPQAGTSSTVLRRDAPARYTVQRGDTLWDIAGRFLADPGQWPRLWRGNPQVDDPHWIYPGDVIHLYRAADGTPRLGLERGQDVVHLSPQVRRVPRRRAVPPLPLDKVQRFLEANRIVAPAQLAQAPYVIAGDDRRLISGAGDHVYVRGALPPGERFGLYRPGERYVAPDTGEFLGLELETLGEARVLRREGDVSRLVVTASRQEIRPGDRLLPLESLPVTPEFQPRPPSHPVAGHILSVPGGVRYIGRLDVVALDLGRREGMAPGTVLAVEQRGETLSDPLTDAAVTLPDEQAGRLMVFRVYDRVSYALVMHATRSLAVGDRVRAPRPAGGRAP
ncbi:LysM peptidoglycan-binding domain-containing protein [Modicisalibacter tunisiensis]|uniref:LysM peptidoglycan-binding domain-containing protein n=1 Tax=Modicisalibacter tunisiensis TaxID=390637 RepID=A0ABS7WYD6_9GAMM|nr:LysM domain-containing protein [Modicisalibacter tunisiensis]MBZ9567646.1 LysM peptidoglycan-binding domain-containing protein [Modicisalibacter tunisiensis]